MYCRELNKPPARLLDPSIFVRGDSDAAGLIVIKEDPVPVPITVMDLKQPYVCPDAKSDCRDPATPPWVPPISFGINGGLDGEGSKPNEGRSVVNAFIDDIDRGGGVPGQIPGAIPLPSP